MEVVRRITFASIWRARRAWISWPLDRAQQRVRNRRRAQRPEAAQAARRLADQWIVGEAAQELRVVVVDPQHEAHVLDPCVALCPDENPAVLCLDRR